MPKSTVFCQEWLDFFFLNIPISGLADPAASGNATQYYLALHTADPTAAGDQTSNECNFGSYARVAVPRSSLGFTRSGTTVTLTSNRDFAAATTGSQTAVYFSLGMNASGASTIRYYGLITSPGGGIPISGSAGTVVTLTTACQFTEA